MRASCVCVCDQEVVMCTTVRCLDKYNMHKSDCCTKFEAWSLHKVEWWWNVNADDAEQVRGLSYDYVVEMWKRYKKITELCWQRQKQ